ncbi:phage antirepressor KilAC domain-containing protein [Chromobacterium haemolyticum]|uniref:phage antirepressor KilAC domain-containing protein n=1 Tax=Chromobacterium haemolyticum TaxID=394935 RepID=UPI00159353C5|nr:phage antirepressor KilAC domain-containing protein [Chromobacterium haemolyticum]
MTLANQVAEQAPKVAAQERLALSEGELCLTDAAKALGVPPGKFTAYLIRIGWAYRCQSNNRPVGYTVKEQQGLVVHRPVTIYHKSGDVESSSQLLITPKGLARLAELIATGDVA